MARACLNPGGCPARRSSQRRLITPMVAEITRPGCEIIAATLPRRRRGDQHRRLGVEECHRSVRGSRYVDHETFRGRAAVVGHLGA